MASPKKLYPGQKEGESVFQYLRRKRWEKSQLNRLGIVGIEGLTDQELLQPIESTSGLMPTVAPPKTKEKTVITQVDDEAVPDKTVTTIEQLPPDTTAAATDVALPLETQQVEAVTRAPPAAVREQVDPFADKSAGSPDVLIARTLGMPVDLVKAGINGLVKALGGPDNLIDNPVMGSRWLMENKGLTIGEVAPLVKQFVDETLPAAGQAVEQALYPGQITQPDDTDGLVTDALTPATGEHEQEGILSYTGPDIAERVTEETITPPTTTEEDKPKPEASTVGGSEVIDPAVKAELEREWGKWTYKPRERRDKFMGQLNRIYMKGAMLDAIAAFSGGESRSAQYIERAMGKLNAITKFDQEERLYNIWHDVYYDKNGNYDPPKTKKEAAMRARRLGANPEETKSIYGWSEEGQDLQQWWRPADNAQGYEVTQTSGKKEAPPKGGGADWQQGSVPTTLSAPSGSKNRIYWTNGEDEVLLHEGVTPESLGYTGEWKEGRKDAAEGKVPGGKPEIDFIENVYANNGYGEAGKAAAVEALVARMRVDPSMYGLIGEYVDESHRATAVRMVDNWIRAYESRGRKSYSSQGATASSNVVVIGAVD